LATRKLLYRIAQVVSAVEQQAVRFRQALADVLRHTLAKRFFDGAVLQLRAQFFHRRDIELLINPQDALGV
jgi:hypothetical protein